MARRRRRVLKASIVLGAVGAGLALAAGPAAADTGPLIVTPHAGLHNGQAVSVSWDTGQPWSNSSIKAQAAECAHTLPAGPVGFTDILDCNTPVALVAVKAADGDLAYEGTVDVASSYSDQVGNPHTCTNQCTIFVLQGTLTPTGLSSGSVRITFPK